MAALKACLSLAGALACTTAAAQLLTYTENETGERQFALGYPVPLPQASQTAGDGFRAYPSLTARLQDLALTHEDLRADLVGRTAAGREIWAYRAGDADSLSRDGRAEAAVLQNGGIHAREWASPEVVAGIVERLMQPESIPGLRRYLLDNLSIVLVPVLNVDGFLQTQRYPDTALKTEFIVAGAQDAIGGDPPAWPRDGRMRRKNMRCDAAACVEGLVDEALDIGGDGMYGTDNNRNNAPYFNSGQQNSDDARSLLYRGAAAGTEPENQALYAAAALAPAARLRLYIDTHSFSRVYFSVDTPNTRRNAIQQQLAQRMSAVSGGRYPYDATPSGVGIGSTDETFAYTHEVPAYTLEIEPGANGAVEYGGFGVEHDGFILPAAQIARVRDELSDAALLGYYRMAGPPAVAAVEIRERDSGARVYAAHWQTSDARTRRYTVTQAGELRNDIDYRLWLAFDKPMRVRDAAGAVVQYRGQNVPLSPVLVFEGVDGAGNVFSQPLSGGSWLATAGAAPAGYRDYADDAYTLEFRVPAATPLAGASRVGFRIEAQDFSGQALDASPATALDFEHGAWARYEDSSGAVNDSGGGDRSLRLIDDGSSPFAAPAAVVGDEDGGGGGAISPWNLIFLLVLRRRPRC